MPVSIMTILRTRLQTQFESKFTVVEGGSGVIKGVLTDINQGAAPANVYTLPRSVLRTSIPTALKAGMVLQSKAGNVYLVGDNGPEEYAGQTLFYSWRLFPATRKVSWQRRIRTPEIVTRMLHDAGVTDLGQIWVVIEPLDRAQLERKLHTQLETYHFAVGKAVLPGDILDGRTVSRSDLQQGVYVGVAI